MNQLTAWIHRPLANALGWALVHFVWQGAALAAVLAAILFVIRPASARVRYGAACLLLLAMPIAFGVTLALLLPAHPVRAAVPIQLAAPVFDSVADSGTARVPVRLREVLPWLAPVWIFGVAIFYARGLTGWLAAGRLRRRGVCSAPPGWQERLDRLCARMRVSRPVLLLESCFADVPALIGYVRPVILIPLGCLAGLSVSQVECILIHELAHIRRHDYLVNLLQSFVEGLLFYHPAVWWVSRTIRTERENCCDDQVVEIAGDARAYAATLAVLEQGRFPAPQAALAATGGNLMNRIRRILRQPQPSRTSAGPAWAAGLLLLSFALALAAWPARSPVPRRHPAPLAAMQTPVAATAVATPAALNEVPQAAPDAMLDQAAPPQPQVQDLTDKERKAREQAVRPELQTPYRKWLNEDVAYIITNEERATFRSLQSDEEREKFIEQFWLRRDPTPGTSENEFKEEHYRRIAYANEHSAAGVPGWKTDLGRIYITYGPPDEIADHSSGGVYQQPPAAGGGTISTVPFQQWRYRHIDGIGDNVIIEFVDPTRSGEFHMTMDPSEKDSMRPDVRVVQLRRDTGTQILVIITLDASAAFHIFGEVTTPAGLIVQSFESDSSGQKEFTKLLPLQAGNYRLVVAMKNLTTGLAGRRELTLTVQ